MMRNVTFHTTNNAFRTWQMHIVSKALAIYKSSYRQRQMCALCRIINNK